MPTTTAATPHSDHRYPTQWIDVLTLRDGRRATLRPVLPQDDLPEQAFVAGLSVRARRMRFHGAVTGLTPSRAEQMTRIDYQRHMGFVVTVCRFGAETVIADARYVLGDDGETAEFAIVVADAWQGQGLGKRLIGTLLQCAHRAGARWLVGEVLAGNHDMLALVQRCGFSSRAHPADESMVRIERLTADGAGAAANDEDDFDDDRGDSMFDAFADALPRWLRPRRASSGAASL